MFKNNEYKKKVNAKEKLYRKMTPVLEKTSVSLSLTMRMKLQDFDLST